MAKKNDELSKMINSMIVAACPAPKERKIVDIITFCEDPRFLNFHGQDPKLDLWVMQRIVLKLFYRGSEGNETIELTEEEIAVLKDINDNEDLDYNPELGGFWQVYEKYKRGVLFTHMLLIMGRRSSKTMMVSIIAAYEAYKLCEAPEGNPQKKYGMAADKIIHIINVAVSEAQALDPLFAEIESRISRAPYFIGKIGGNSIKGKIYILTDADKAENARRLETGAGVQLPGSIVLMSGHSNSASLRGHATICVLFDEFAHFVTSAGKSSGDEVYNALTPSMKQFGSDGKIVMLSDPRGKEGMFWRLFQLSQKRDKKHDGTVVYASEDTLAIQLPTWRVNPGEDFVKETLEKKERAKDPMAFSTSYGARFIGSQGSKFFDEAKIEQCIDFALQEKQSGDPGLVYYIHLDPATTSHNYALCMVHTQQFINSRGDAKRKVIVDHVKFWTPTVKEPVAIKEVEDYVKNLCRRFRVSSVTFDSFASQQTIQNLQMSGINAFETAFRSAYITLIYGELRNLVNQGDLILLPHDQLIGEMKELMYKMLGTHNIKKFFDQKGEFRSDDCVDALAGAAYQAMHTVIVKSLPRSRCVQTGFR